MLMASGEILTHKRYGDAYHSLTIVSPEIGEQARPGQFVSIRLREDSAQILRRPFSVYRMHKRGGWASTIEIVFDIRGAGTRYLSQLRAHSTIDIVGPTGRGFVMPKRRAHCLLVGGGIGAAPLFFLADELRNEGHRVDFVMGARTSGLLLNPIDVRRLASVYRMTTEDGSQGDRGRVTDVLAETMERCGTEVVYACGPHPMLAAVSEICMERETPVQVAVEELMACGYGACMTCVMPVRRPPKRGEDPADAVVYARACTDGPVFNGASIVWHGSGTEPVAADQQELTPANVAVRDTGLDEVEDEHAPPGN
ncbi:MAG: dihydroorotate dehydrogenase electron transfer subunit [Actinobacteria bacterium]|jgi:dihydroorotate dehydrogenase electron transfer subunit|nr:dihydroorotate dehydrogenase electron transfer subunit [Actinomycetota bacterium]